MQTEAVAANSPQDGQMEIHVFLFMFHVKKTWWSVAFIGLDAFLVFQSLKRSQAIGNKLPSVLDLIAFVLPLHDWGYIASSHALCDL